MSRVRFHNDGTAGGKRGSGISSGDRERERKVAGTKNDNRAKRPEHGTDVWFASWLAIRNGSIDARHHPRALLNHAGKQTKLRAGARQFAL
jgi:hypothetical protein